jgi:antitoxin (DNA-binding transcriptional repressor) of toxin-antitoxin stability system
MKTITMMFLRSHLREILDATEHKGESFTVTRNGRPAGIVGPTIGDFARLAQWREWARKRCPGGDDAEMMWALGDMIEIALGPLVADREEPTKDGESIRLG